MKQYHAQSVKQRLHRPQPILLAGILLFLMVLILSGWRELRLTSTLVASTTDTLRQQCVSYDRLVAADRTKSLFRLADSVQELSRHLEDNPATVTAEYLARRLTELRLSGAALLDEEGNVMSYYAPDFEGSHWRENGAANRFRRVTGTNTLYTERLLVNGQYFDIAAVSRPGASWLLVGFYRQPYGLIAEMENDMAALLDGLHLDRGGSFLITKNDTVLAASDTFDPQQSRSTEAVPEALSLLPVDGRLHPVHMNGGLYLACRTACEGYKLYLYFPVWSVFSPALVIGATFAALYVAFWLVVIVIRNRSLSEKQQELRRSNRQLQENINMLRSLENIYFTIFYVDVAQDRYESVFLAPWLKGFVPEEGVYTELKDTFINGLVLEEYRSEIEEHMALPAIRRSLRKAELSAVRQSYYVDYQAHRGDQVVWCRVTVLVVDLAEDGTPAHVLAVLQDVNQEKAREAAYQARIVAEAQEARMANSAKSEFLRRISHDIRTPINGIQGYIRMASRHPEDRQLQIMCRDKISAALNILLELVSSVLDMSKLESSEIAPEEKSFDLSRLLGELDAIMEPQAAEHGISYRRDSCDGLPCTRLVGSPLHLRQILMNLINNAVKYGRQGGHIHVTCQPVSQTADTVNYCFVCEDDGIGMTPEFQEHLFEPFTQEATNARTQYQGVGLGLSIVKKLVDTLGGTITFTSQKGQGTCFRVTLPFRIDHGEAAVPTALPADVPDPLPGLRVLLVEDNELNMEIAEFLLQEHGAHVTRAWNGAEAVQQFSQSPEGSWDLILMDVMMPVMDGLEAARAIRCLPRKDAGTIPILAMSANAFSDDVQRSLEAGMNGHIAKPVDEGRLLEAVRRVLPVGTGDADSKSAEPEKS